MKCLVNGLEVMYPCSHNCPLYGDCMVAFDAVRKSRVRTNADRIRAMSDEELAEFLILSPEMEFDVCRYCEYGNPTPMDDRGFCLHPYGSCLANAKVEAFKKWLKQPVKDGDNDGNV